MKMQSTNLLFPILLSSVTFNNLAFADVGILQDATLLISTPAVAVEDVTADDNFQQIHAGNFMMGTPQGKDLMREDNEVYHKVTITQDFQLQKTQVTQLQYFKVTGKNPSFFSGKSVCADTYVEVNGVGMCPNQPVEQLNWIEAEEFAKILSRKSKAYKYRLPTEAEFEYSARAGTTTSHWFGDVPKENYYEDSTANNSIWYFYSLPKPESTHPVAALKPNAWGLYDVAGNVGQWVQDSYRILSTRDAVDSLYENESRYKCFRGGGLYSAAHDTRSAYRFFGPPTIKAFDIGIRLVRVKIK